jgi:predicted DsbA family dithiol-disulfide isomerase
MARLTGLNEDRFREDLNSDAAKQAVANSNDQAQQTGVNSTPTVVINGQNLSAASAEQIHDVVLQLSSAP